jgi:hypothetical protein
MEGPTFDLVAASLRADTTDLTAFVEGLAERLGGAFGDRMRVERSGTRLSRSRRVRRIVLELDKDRFVLEHDAAQIRCRREALVRGVAIRSDELALEEWLEQLSRALVVESETSAQARAALARLLE